MMSLVIRAWKSNSASAPPIVLDVASVFPGCFPNTQLTDFKFARSRCRTRRMSLVKASSFANNQTVLKGFVCQHMRGLF